MKKAIIATSLAAVLSNSANADTLLGLYIGGHVWANQAEGSLGKEEMNQTTFDFDNKNQGSYFVALEHPIPLIPNIKISSTTLDTVGDANINVSSTVDGVTSTVSVLAKSTFDASYVDYTLYYELFDNDLLTFDFGLTGRDLSLESTVDVGELSSSQDLDLSASGILPMLYVSTIIGLPFTGLNVFAEGNFISYDDHSLYDYQVGVSYEVLDNLAVDMELKLGYRAVKLELNDIDDLYSDLTFDGVFAGVTMHF